MIQTRSDIYNNRQSGIAFCEIERKKEVKHIRLNPKLWIFPRIEKDEQKAIAEFNRLNNIFNQRIFRDDNLS